MRFSGLRKAQRGPAPSGQLLNSRSIRFRLALSFAGIALVAALALGAVLLVILQNYYFNQELAYLRGNAKVVSGLVMGTMSSTAPHDELQSQIDNLAFLSQTRIQVYDPAGKLLLDSGSRGNVNQLSLGVVKRVTSAQAGSPSRDMVFIAVAGSKSQSVPAQSSSAPNVEALPGPGGGSVFVYRSLQAGSSPFGFQLKVTPDGTSSGERSALSFVEAVRDPQSNSQIGSVKLSEGPAYGSEILRSVAAGWLMASFVAVLLAAAMGWWISRRISAPILALTEATARMAQGDLTSRASVRSRDEIGQLGRSFNEMASQVEGTVTALRQFVLDASHELRTPLTALRTNLEIALDQKDAAERQVSLARAQAMIQRLEELNSNLLDLSRLEANGHAGRQEVDLAELVRARVEIYASQADQADLSFDAALPSTPIPVQADPLQIARAMDNLVENACKFTPAGGAVRIALQEQSGHAVFSVADSGIGIPADDLPQIFNRFHRGRNANSVRGSGLGLAIVKVIVEAHRGEVLARSAGEGKGSEFSMTLPRLS